MPNMDLSTMTINPQPFHPVTSKIRIPLNLIPPTALLLLALTPRLQYVGATVLKPDAKRITVSVSN